MVIFLVGFMGSGKNWWGSVLAEHTGVPFYDLDEAVEQAEGMDIVSIFREKGEGYFREAESKILEELAAEVISVEAGANAWTAIIATGGGTPCFNNNMNRMNELGLTVWLNPTIEELANRLEKETEKRPLLQGKKGKVLTDLIAGKLLERKPFYEMAQIEIKNTHIAVEEFLNLLPNASDIY